jgi:hypothetical protein
VAPAPDSSTGTYASEASVLVSILHGKWRERRILKSHLKSQNLLRCLYATLLNWPPAVVTIHARHGLTDRRLRQYPFWGRWSSGWIGSPHHSLFVGEVPCPFVRPEDERLCQQDGFVSLGNYATQAPTVYRDSRRGLIRTPTRTSWGRIGRREVSTLPNGESLTVYVGLPL